MTRAALPAPGLLWGPNPERRPVPRDALQRLRDALLALPDRLAAWRRRDDAAFLARVQAGAAEVALDAEGLQRLRARLAREGLGAGTVALGLAAAAAAAQQALGQQPYDSQLIAARAVLEGRLAEMATGEGKTLTVALAAAVGALAGLPVHAITANDYLVARDADKLRPGRAKTPLAAPATLASVCVNHPVMSTGWAKTATPRAWGAPPGTGSP
jgi:preprotein translocase subunit SecA